MLWTFIFSDAQGLQTYQSTTDTDDVKDAIRVWGQKREPIVGMTDEERTSLLDSIDELMVGEEVPFRNVWSFSVHFYYSSITFKVINTVET